MNDINGIINYIFTNHSGDIEQYWVIISNIN